MCERCQAVRKAAERLDDELGAALRKGRSRRRYNRSPRENGLALDFRTWLDDGAQKMLDYLAGTGKLVELRAYLTAYHPVEKSGLVVLEKAALTDRDRDYFAALLADFGPWGEDALQEKAAAIVQLHHFTTYEEAAKFVLARLGMAAPDFELRNPAIRELILDRKQMAYFSEREGIDRALAALVKHCAAAGDGPYDEALLVKIQDALGYEYEGHALRFAQTEVGFAAEQAQRDTFRKVGVGFKAWRHSGRGPGAARPNHVALDGVVVAMEAKFHLAAADGSAVYSVERADGPEPARRRGGQLRLHPGPGLRRGRREIVPAMGRCVMGKEMSVILKADRYDDEEGVLYGWGSVAEVEDGQGDIVPNEEMARLIHGFMILYYAGQARFTLNHQEEVEAAVLVESAPQWFGGALRWHVGILLLSEELRRLARAGEIQGFSIGGEAVREEAPDGQ